MVPKKNWNDLKLSQSQALEQMKQRNRGSVTSPVMTTLFVNLSKCKQLGKSLCLLFFEEQGRKDKEQEKKKSNNKTKPNKPPHNQNKTNKTTAIKPHHPLLSETFRKALQVLQPYGSHPSFPVSTRQHLKKGRRNEAHTQEPFHEKSRLNWPYSESSLHKISNSCLKTTHL